MPTSISTQLTLPVNLRLAIVVGDRRAELVAEIEALVAGERHRRGPLDAAFADRYAVDVQGDVSALAEPAAVVGELHAHLMGARRDGLRAVDVGLLEPEEVVAELRLPPLV